jgi:hypothetical protein
LGAGAREKRSADSGDEAVKYLEENVGALYVAFGGEVGSAGFV